MSDAAQVRDAARQTGDGVVARVVANLELAVHAPHETLELCVFCLLAEGHLIIEDFPGVGKTVLAKSLARSLDLSFSRLQFTPDLLPTDVTGVNVFNQKSNEFEFRRGPVFANVLLVDEINRASPKTQSALLEAMQECQVTIDGVTYALEPPFLVVATQNPIEYEGTYPLPEAQLDRFTAMLSLGYPGATEEARMLGEQTTAPPLDDLRPVAGHGRSAGGGARLRAPSSSRRASVATSSRLLRHTRANQQLALGREPALRDRAATDGEGARGRSWPRLRPAGGRAGRRETRALPPADRRTRGARRRNRAGGGGSESTRRDAGTGLMRRGGALVLGGVVLGVAIVFASRPLGVVGLGLLVAGLVSRAWSALAAGPVDVQARVEPDPATEGDDVVLRFAARRRFADPRRARRSSQARSIGSVRTSAGCPAAADPWPARSRWASLPRGQYLSANAEIEVREPLGLETRSHPLGRGRLERSCTRGSSSSSRCGATGDDAWTTAVDSSCGELRASISTRCASTSRESRFVESTGRRARSEGVSWSRSSRMRPGSRSSSFWTATRRVRRASRRARASTQRSAPRARSCGPTSHAAAARCSRRRAPMPRSRAPSSLEGDFQAVLVTLAAANADARHELARFLDRPPPTLTRRGGARSRHRNARAVGRQTPARLPPDAAG